MNATKQPDFAVTIDGRTAFSTNDACIALQFYDSAIAGFRGRGIDKEVSITFKGIRLSEKQVKNVSWC